MKKFKSTFLFASGLLAFTVYTLLDSFVISNAYQDNATGMNLAMFETEILAGENSMSQESVTTEEVTETAAEVSSEELNASETRPGQDSTEENGYQRDKQSGGSRRDRAGRGKPKRNSTGSDTETSSIQDKTVSEPVTTDNVISGTTYEDENISITLSEYVTNDTTVYVADVILSSAQYLKTAFAADTYGKNVTDETSDIAYDNQAILAINGDYYGAQEAGYVIRNGIVYRGIAGDAEMLCIYADGTMKIKSSSEMTAQELVDEGVWQAFSFGPGLLIDGAVAVTENEETGKAKASNPRTAIGMIDDLHYLFVVSDGRTEESEGLSLYELASFMKELGATTAYNLDGGGSSTMVFQNEVINNPTSSGKSIKERKVSDIVYIG